MIHSVCADNQKISKKNYEAKKADAKQYENDDPIWVKYLKGHKVLPT